MYLPICLKQNFTDKLINMLCMTKMCIFILCIYNITVIILKNNIIHRKIHFYYTCVQKINNLHTYLLNHI